MITRGHFIGEIVDELSSLAHQIAVRSKLGLLDLNVYSENFFRDVFNALYGWKLANLNENRSNEPGLDLGDKHVKVAIQVTSRSDAGQKQGSYQLETTLCDKYGFKVEHILDATDLCRKTMDLPIDKLQSLHRLIRKNVVKLLIELELPDPETDKFPTSGFDKWEVKPEPKIGTGRKFANWYSKDIDQKLTPAGFKAIQDDLVELGQRLRRLPRVTREFLAMLFERRSLNESKRFRNDWSAVRFAIVEREYSGRP